MKEKGGRDEKRGRLPEEREEVGGGLRKREKSVEE